MYKRKTIDRCDIETNYGYGCPERRWEWPTELTEKVTKPCPVCGNVFLGNRYAGITDVCPSCLSKLKAAMKKGGETNGQIS